MSRDERKDPIMSRPLPSAGPIVVGVDGSAGSKAATVWSAQAAERHDAPLVLLHALAIPDFYAGPTVPPTEELLHKVRVRGESIAREMTEVAEHVAVSAVETRISDDAPALALLDVSRDARMIVLGSTEHNRLTSLFGGSVTTSLAAHASCPVVSVRGRTWDLPGARNRPVVVGVDGGSTSDLALTAAFAEASARDAELIAVHAWGHVGGSRSFGDSLGNYEWELVAESARNRVAGQLAPFRDSHPDVKVQQVAVRDDPRQELLRWSVKAQLIIVGSRGRGGFRGLLLGSTGQALLHHAACPVLIARTAAPGK
ncbi:universal stress protein [Amycolatopsis alba DSM 44262]|uniref:Universal stress protein n=2 Tax=Amycolatopsis alba TaxID=76020 RepID=A0A229RG91_AMYAL|nr:universal stress protein [Amycolatopsis alba DSM 44262]